MWQQADSKFSRFRHLFFKRRTDAINRSDRLIKAVETEIKVKNQPQIPDIFSAVNKARQSQLFELLQQNSSVWMVKRLMSALQGDNQILHYLDLEEKKRAIDERMISNEKLREDTIANAKMSAKRIMLQHVGETLQKKSDIKWKLNLCCR